MVYVDESRYHYGRMIMCHMMADTQDELHAMATQIGVARRHYQEGRYNHYDICKAMRSKALDLGAKELTTKELIRLARKVKC